jgi:hypothetical protein
MNRALILVLVITLLPSAACLRTSTSRSANQSSSTAETGNRSSYAAAAAKLEDVCPLMPADFVQRLAPGAYPPSKERYPLRCTVRNDKSALEITFETGPDEPVKGAEFIAGLAKGGYLERLDPHDRGDVYLTVILGRDESDINRNLHVEVAGHDGRDHKDDAIQVARAVLGKLNG